MSVQPLFLEIGFNSSFNKIAEDGSIKLPEDESKWSQTITDHIAANVPELNKYPVEISLDEKDPKSGYAKGSITVSGKITVPMLVKSFRLSPLDVFIYEDQFFPLNQRTLDSVLMDKSLVEKTVSTEESRGEGGGLRESSSPPYSAQGLGGRGRKFASALNSVKSIEKNDVDTFYSRLSSDHSVAYKIASKSKGILSRLEKLAEAKEAVKEEQECNIIQVAKTAFNKYMIYAGSTSDPLNYEEREVTESEAARIFGTSAMSKLASDGFHSVVLGKNGQHFNLPEELSFPTEDLEKFGHYDVITKNKSIVRGYVVPEVYDFKMKKKAGMKLFLSPNMYSMQEKIAGRRVMAGPPSSLPSHEIKEGTTGSFCFRYGEKTASTVPFHITSFPLTSGEQIDFEATTVTGDPIHMTVMPGLASAAPGEKRGHYLIPSIWQFVQVGSYNEPLFSSPNEIVKTAEADTEDKKLEIVWDGVYYQFLGEQVRNISQQVQDLDGMKARFLLTAFGVSPDFADKLLAKAKENGMAETRVDINPVGKYVVETNRTDHLDGSSNTKFASEKVVNFIRGLNDWTKLAAEAGDDDTIDNILSLDFVNKNNVGEFIDSIDSFKESQAKLAKLLVASRLGIKQVPAESVKLAMDSIGEVIDGLEVLRSTFRSNNKKK